MTGMMRDLMRMRMRTQLQAGVRFDEGLDGSVGGSWDAEPLVPSAAGCVCVAAVARLAPPALGDIGGEGSVPHPHRKLLLPSVIAIPEFCRWKWRWLACGTPAYPRGPGRGGGCRAMPAESEGSGRAGGYGGWDHPRNWVEVGVKMMPMRTDTLEMQRVMTATQLTRKRMMPPSCSQGGQPRHLPFGCCRCAA